MQFGAKPLFENVSVKFGAGNRYGLIGANGCGKSTFMKILGDDLEPSDGQVMLEPNVRLGKLRQDQFAYEEFTVIDTVIMGHEELWKVKAERDRIYSLPEMTEEDGMAVAELETEFAEMDGYTAESRAGELLLGLGIGIEQHFGPMSEVSPGWKLRVLLAQALFSDPEVLLLDEPTNHLDRTGLDFLTERLRRRSGGVVVISHDRALLSDVAHTVVDLDPTDDGRPRVHGGGYAGYRRGRRAERERWEQEYAHQQEERSRLRDLLSSAQNRLVSGWRPDKGTGKHQRATRAGGLVKNVHRRQADLDTHEVTMPEPPQRFRFPDLPTRSGTSLLVAEGVTVADRLTTSASFTLRGGSRLVVTGPNGAGKSTLLSVLAGELEPTTGRVYGAGDARIVLLRQESELPLDRRAADVYADAGGSVGLSSLGLLRPRETGKRVGELSMGQRRRLDLALALAHRPHVLLLDEPTNHLSIALVDELTEALEATEAAVVLSTHDRQLLRDVGAWPHLDLSAYARV